MTDEADFASTVDAGWRALLDEDPDDLYENAPCGYLSTLADGTVVKVNATFLGWTGYETSDLVGRRRFQDLLTRGGKIYYETHYAPLLWMQGSAREIALDVVRSDGERIPVLMDSVLKRDATGSPLLIRTTVFNATQRRLYEQELVRAREAAERSEARATLLARTLQESLMPPALPAVPGADIGAAYRAAGTGEEVGGDFYDVFEAQPGKWAVLVGDVCGKGAQAAKATALTRYTARAAALRTRRPRRVLEAVNDAILQDHDDWFCTALYARLYPKPDGDLRVTFSSGGHPLPLLASGDGDPQAVGRTGTLLGVIPSPPLRDTHIDLAPGAALVMYTDGITEARRGDELFGEDGLRRLLGSLRGLDAAATAGRIVTEVVDYQAGHTRDDAVVVVVKAPPAA